MIILVWGILIFSFYLFYNEIEKTDPNLLFIFAPLIMSSCMMVLALYYGIIKG